MAGEISAIDHLVVLVRDLDAAVLAYETILGLAPAWQAQADGAKTASFTLPNVTLELLAPDPSQAGSDRITAALEAQGEGLASICFRVSDIERMHRRLRNLGLNPEPVSRSHSTDQQGGASLSWRRTRADTKATHGVRQFFIELENERPHSAALAAGAASGLDHLVIATPAPERAASLYGARLGLDMRLDLTSQDWGSRLMFFRCGDLIIEIAHGLKTGEGSDFDKLYGLTWRSPDLEASHQRLVQNGCDVSAIRQGRKPGTRVFTLRKGNCGIPTLFIGK